MPVKSKGQGNAAAIFALLLLSLIWGYNFVVMKQVTPYVDPFDFSAIRTLLGAVALFLFAWASGRALPLPPWRPLVVLGLTQTAAFAALIQWALHGGDVGRTVVLVYSMPFWLLALSWLMLSERLGGLQLLGVGGALLGLAFILQPWQGGPPALSALLALLAGLVWAGSAVVARRMRDRHRPDLLATTAWQMLIGALALCLLAIMLPSRPIQYTPYFIGALVYNTLFATSLAWLLWLFILSRLPAGTAGLSTLLVPVIGVVAGWIELGERPDALELGGMGLILLALVAVSVPHLGWFVRLPEPPAASTDLAQQRARP